MIKASTNPLMADTTVSIVSTVDIVSRYGVQAMLTLLTVRTQTRVMCRVVKLRVPATLHPALLRRNQAVDGNRTSRLARNPD
jgi:hypothetical protein